MHQHEALVGLPRKISGDSPGLQERLDLRVARRGALRLLRGVLRRLALGLALRLDGRRRVEELLLLRRLRG